MLEKLIMQVRRPKGVSGERKYLYLVVFSICVSSCREAAEAEWLTIVSLKRIMTALLCNKNDYKAQLRSCPTLLMNCTLINLYEFYE